MRLIVTRPRAQAAAWVRDLQALGRDAVALPLIDIAPLDDTGPLRHAWQRLHGYALVMFVSANAVRHFFDAAPAAARWPAGVLAGSTGPGTSAALRAGGVPEAQLVEPAADTARFDSEALWARLAGRDWAGRRALVVRGEEGRDWLAGTLRAHGAEVEFLAAYRRGPPQCDAQGRAVLDDARRDPAAWLWLFSSSEAVANLRALAPAADWSRSAAAASHPRIAQAARAAGFGRVDRVAPRPADVAALGDARPAGAAPIESGPQ